MKRLHGAASAEVKLPAGDCQAVLLAVADYPSWYPQVVRAVEVTEAGSDGVPVRAEVTLPVSHGPLARDLDLLLEIREPRAGVVELVRIPHGPPDDEEFEVIWRLAGAGPGVTHIELELNAKLAVPRLLPLNGVGEAFAEGFVAAAVERLRAPV